MIHRELRAAWFPPTGQELRRGESHDEEPMFSPEKCLQQVRNAVAEIIEKQIFSSASVFLPAQRRSVVLDLSQQPGWLAAVQAVPDWVKDPALNQFELTQATALMDSCPQAVVATMQMHPAILTEVLGRFAIESALLDAKATTLTVVVNQVA